MKKWTCVQQLPSIAWPHFWSAVLHSQPIVDHFTKKKKKNDPTIFFSNISDLSMKDQILSSWFRKLSSFKKIRFRKQFLLNVFSLHNFFNTSLKPNYLRSNVLRHHFYLPKVIIQVQNGNGVLNRLARCLKCMELACWVLQISLDLCYHFR